MRQVSATWHVGGGGGGQLWVGYYGYSGAKHKSKK
jgi:hypothetical protein